MTAYKKKQAERLERIMSHDVDFDVAAASSWKVEVECELGKVEQVLNEVAEQCTTIPGEQDTIMKGIEETGRFMREQWNNLCSGFQQMCAKFGELIAGRQASINKVAESINNYKSNFHL